MLRDGDPQDVSPSSVSPQRLLALCKEEGGGGPAQKPCVSPHGSGCRVKAPFSCH